MTKKQSFFVLTAMAISIVVALILSARKNYEFENSVTDIINGVVWKKDRMARSCSRTYVRFSVGDKTHSLWTCGVFNKANVGDSVLIEYVVDNPENFKVIKKVWP